MVEITKYGFCNACGKKVRTRREYFQNICDECVEQAVKDITQTEQQEGGGEDKMTYSQINLTKVGGFQR